MARIVIFFFVFVINVGPILAQSKAVDPSFAKISNSAGLANSTVYSIIEDDLGFIWIGTKTGLNRYDGYEAKTLELPTSTEQTSGTPTVFSLLWDSQKIIWIGIKDGGLLTYNKASNKFQRFPFQADETVDWNTITVRIVYEDSRSWIWIGTYGGGAIVLDKERKVIKHFCTYCDAEKNERLSNDFVFDFEEDNQGNVVIATAGKGLNVYDVQTQSVSSLHSDYEEDMNSFGKTICFDNAGKLWIGTEGNGLYMYDAPHEKWDNYAQEGELGSTDIITDIQKSPDGKLWLATDGAGLIQLNPSTTDFLKYSYDVSKPTTLSTDALYDLFFDRSDNLWIGTFNGGVNVLNAIQPPFYTSRQYDSEKRIGLRSVLAVEEDMKGKVWLGTDGGGMFFFDTVEDELKLQNASSLASSRIFSDVITCIEADEDGGLWFGSFSNGLYYFDYQDRTIDCFRNEEGDSSSLAHNNVWALERDRNGGLWIGTLGGGVDYLPAGSRKFQHVGAVSNVLSDVQVIDILLDQRNEYLWIATESKGLNRLDIASGEIDYYNVLAKSEDRRISSNNLLSLFEDEDNNIWILTDLGVEQFDPISGNIHRLELKNRFAPGTILSIEQDNEGFIWLTTADGIHRLDTAKGMIVDFGYETGLAENLYNSRAAKKLSDGRIIFGGVRGFSMLRPEQVELDDEEVVPVFTGLTLSNKSIDIGKYDGREILLKDMNAVDAVVKLTHEDRSILFEISALPSIDPSKNTYAYILEGFEKEWNYLDGSQRSIFYSSLDGGKYTLKIKAANSSGKWSSVVRSIDISVRPPFWKTIWFVIISLLTILAIIFLAYRYLLNRQKEDYERHALEQQQEIMQKEQEILQLKNMNLEEEISNKKAELTASILQMAHKNEFLTVLKGRINKIKSESGESAAKPLRSVVNIINSELRQEDYWEQFHLIFNQTYQDFIDLLAAEFPVLTSNDHRLCCFIRMKLNNREIASILNITLSAVEQAKYRLKKKLKLDKTGNLYEFLQKITV